MHFKIEQIVKLSYTYYNLQHSAPEECSRLMWKLEMTQCVTGLAAFKSRDQTKTESNDSAVPDPRAGSVPSQLQHTIIHVHQRVFIAIIINQNVFLIGIIIIITQ